MDLKGHREEHLTMHRSLFAASRKQENLERFRSAEERVLDHEQDGQTEKDLSGIEKSDVRSITYQSSEESEMTAASSRDANNAEHFDGDGDDDVSDGQVTRNINQMLSLIIPLFSMLLACPLLTMPL